MYIISFYSYYRFFFSSHSQTSGLPLSPSHSIPSREKTKDLLSVSLYISGFLFCPHVSSPLFYFISQSLYICCCFLFLSLSFSLFFRSIYVSVSHFLPVLSFFFPLWLSPFIFFLFISLSLSLSFITSLLHYLPAPRTVSSKLVRTSDIQSCVRRPSQLAPTFEYK